MGGRHQEGEFLATAENVETDFAPWSRWPFRLRPASRSRARGRLRPLAPFVEGPSSDAWWRYSFGMPHVRDPEAGRTKRLSINP